MMAVKFRNFHTVEKNSSNQVHTYVVISLVTPLLSRNFCEKSVRENLCNFHTVRSESNHEVFNDTNFVMKSLLQYLAEEASPII